MEKILIVEDRRLVAEDLKEAVEDFGYEVTTIAATKQAALESIQQTPPNLVLIDINLKKEPRSGIQLAEAIMNSGDPIPFIYITALTDEETIELVKKTKPQAYIIKPYRDADLQIQIKLALNSFYGQRSSDFIFVKHEKQHHKVYLADILFVEADGSYVKIHVKGKGIYKPTMNLTEFANQLKEGTPLVRIHRSYMVNIKYILTFTNHEVTLKGLSTTLPISKGYRAHFMEQVPKIK